MISKKKLGQWLLNANDDSFDSSFYEDMAKDLIEALEDGSLEPDKELPCKHKFFSWGRLKVAGLAWSRRCKKCGYQEITYKNPIKE